MTKNYGDPAPWEDDETPTEKFERGSKLIERHGTYKIHNEVHWDHLMGLMSVEELKAYAYAYEPLEELSDWKPPFKPQQPRANDFASLRTENAVQTSASEDVLIQAAIDRFAQDKSNDANRATIAKYKSQCLIFLKIVAPGNPNIRLRELKAAHVRHYVDILYKLPKKTSPDEQMSIEELIKIGRPTISATTRSAHGRAVSMFLT